MKVVQPRSDHINQTFHIDHLTEKNQTITKDQTQTKNESFCSEGDTFNKIRKNEFI